MSIDSNLHSDTPKRLSENDRIDFHKQEYPEEEFRKDFDFIKLINKRDGKKVDQYFYKPLKHYLAVKSIITTNKEFFKIKDEIEILYKLRNSDHVVRLYGVTYLAENFEHRKDGDDKIPITLESSTKFKTLICMEFMDFSLNDIFNWCIKTKNRITNKTLGAIASSIVSALTFLKQHKVMHRDIKPENILINRDGQLKLADFGDAKIVVDSIQVMTIKGTYLYWSLERFKKFGNQLGYDDTSDIWALGLILLQFITGKRPYPDLGKHRENILRVQVAVEEFQHNSESRVKNFLKHLQERELKQELLDFIIVCLKPKSSRPNCIQIQAQRPSYNLIQEFRKPDVCQKAIRQFIQDVIF